MSYAHNRRKKKDKQFSKKLAYNFGEFCKLRGITNWSLLPKKEYDQLWSYWISYRDFYKIKERN